ncbi:signal peptidase I [Haloplanus sp.]|uniref:signal peptidase I n=1 Tax=Haloplanus sp. TaxID=1961696 RepID=UPI00263739AC|nr:signal peptidase I [Haloplanus sp.]
MASIGRMVSASLEIVAVFVILVLVVGQAIGGPVVLGFVRTGSMQPALDPGDGFLAVPIEVAGPVESGDVIVFRAEEIQGGGLTTHRVVGETERGYVTRGDNNAVTDQDSGEPPVKNGQIVSKVVRLNGQVLVLPHLGDATSSVQETAVNAQRRLAVFLGVGSILGTTGGFSVLAAIVFALYLVDTIRNGRGRSRDRGRTRSREFGLDPRLVVGALTLILLLGLTLPMAVPSGTERIDFVSASFESERPTVIQTGESKGHDRRLSNAGLLPTKVYVKAPDDDVDVEPGEVRLAPDSETNVTVTLHAPDSTGGYHRFVSHYHYLAVLPDSMLDSLYRWHPWLPIIVIDALMGVPFYVVGCRLLGRERIGGRSRDRPGSLRTRLRRFVR